MSEPGKIASANGASARGAKGVRGKSINMIRTQMGRIQDAFRDAYYKAKNGNYNEMDAELARLNRRLNAVNQVANRYEKNIQEQPEYNRITQELRRTFREGGRSADEAKETAKRINQLRERRNNLKYARSVYARRNNRWE